jgi:hypothetical protein
MNISGANAYAYLQDASSVKRTNAGTTSSAGSAPDASSNSAGQASEGSIQTIDFTHITRAGLADWVNAQIKSGRMSLQDSSTFVSMTVKIPVNGGYTGLDSQESVNFMQLAQSGMTWAQQNNDPEMLKHLQTALGVMQANQGQTAGVDLTV